MPDTASALTETPEPAPGSQTLSQVERVVNTFIEPSKTFADIKRNRSWWLPFLILAVLGYIFCFVAVQHVGWESLTTNVLKSQPRNAERLDKANPAEQAQMLAVTKGFMVGFMVGSPVVVLAVNALIALLLWAGFAFVLGGSTTYGEMFAVAIFAALPNALNSLVAIVTVFASDPQGYNLNLPSPANLAYFLSSDSAAWLLAMAKSLDVFSLWSLVLAGFGGAIVAKVKPLRGIVLVLGVWILYVLVKTGIAAATS
ncbi:MAG TPA: YIP1 family protein [Acidobacteriaceae bacterium]|nr:YIP1 family protein [Acidobacteriaceae bacterium]